MSSEYRHGVEDALKSFEESEVWGLMVGCNHFPGSTSYLVDGWEALAAKRKEELLNKKVTKWINIYEFPDGSFGTSGSVYDSEEEGLRNRCILGKDRKWVKTTSIEIEAPVN